MYRDWTRTDTECHIWTNTKTLAFLTVNIFKSSRLRKIRQHFVIDKCFNLIPKLFNSLKLDNFQFFKILYFIFEHLTVVQMKQTHVLSMSAFLSFIRVESMILFKHLDLIAKLVTGPGLKYPLSNILMF